MDVEYRYDTAGRNNGQIGSMKDWMSEEEVVYTYDRLARLTRAETVSSLWGQSNTLDGFGNLTAQTVTKGSAPAMSLAVSGTTNRITSSGFSYNANGTMAAMPNWQGTYDKESRLVDVTQSQNGTESYEYDGAGRRIWISNETMMFYGVDGKRLAKCQIQEVSYPAYGYTFACTGITYFLGQVVTGEGESGGWGPWGAARDRLGSVRAAPYGYYYYGQGVNASSYFPYGQARTGGSVWATYQPSSVSGTMYAMNREYSAAYGRFLTPDPSAGVSLGNPGSWNKYGYVLNDPVNRLDPSGLDGCTAEPGTAVCFSVTGTGGSVADNPGFAMARAWYGLDSKGDTPLLLARQVGGRGRGGSAGTLHVADPRKEGEAYDSVLMAFGRTLAFLDPDCEGYLNSGGGDVRSYVSDLIANDMLAVGVFDVDKSAFTNTRGSDLSVGYAAMVFNTTSAFFTATANGSRLAVNNGRIGGGTPKAQAFIILHELGHAMSASGFRADLDDSGAGRSNDDLINSNCKKTLGDIR